MNEPEIGNATLPLDSLSLDTIARTIEVLKRFEKGMTDMSLTDYLQNEISLSKAYLIFFKQMGWIERNESPLWRLTEKGKQTLAALTAD